MTIAPRALVTVAIVATGLLLPPGVADASSPRPSVARTIGGGAPERGTAGSSSTLLSSDRFKVDGSPYRWSFEVTQCRSGPGSPPDDPTLRIIAQRRAPTGVRPIQVHTWGFDLAAGSLQLDGDLRHVSVDTGLIPGFGAIFMDLRDLRAIETSRTRCPRTGDVVSRTSRRRGLLLGSMTFLPGYADPQMPPDVNPTRVRGRIERTRYTGADCSYPNMCDPGKLVQGIQTTGPGVGYLVNGERAGRTSALVFQQYEMVGVARMSHLAIGFGRVPVLTTTPTTVELASRVFGPFAAPGGAMTWTKGVKDVRQNARCVRTSWPLTSATGSFDLLLDSGAQTVVAPVNAGFEITKRR